MKDKGRIALDWAYLMNNTYIDDCLNSAASSSSKKNSIYKFKQGEGKPTDDDIDSTMPTVVLHHGLCGDSTSEHIIHLAGIFQYSTHLNPLIPLLLS
jgi:predicted alpha/beta-fold hydrolase